MTGPNAEPQPELLVQRLLSGVDSVNDFISELGLVCTGHLNQYLVPPKGSRIQVVPLEGAALPVDKYRGYVSGRFLSYDEFVPREAGEPLDVSFFLASFTESGLHIKAVYRREALGIDETLDLTRLDIPFDIVKIEEPQSTEAA